MQRSECMLIVTEPYKLCLMYKLCRRATYNRKRVMHLWV